MRTFAFLLIFLTSIRTFAVTQEETDFYIALDSAMIHPATGLPTLADNSGAETLPEWKIILAEGDSAMAAALCTEQLPAAQPGSKAFADMADFLDEYYSSKEGTAETYLYRMMATETLNLRSGHPDAQRLVRIGELLEETSPKTAADCYLLAVQTVLQAAGATDGIDYNACLSSVRVTKEDVNLLIFFVIAVALIAICVTATWLSVRRRYRREAAGTDFESNGQSTQNGTRSMLRLALSAFAQTKELNLLVDRKLTAGQTKDLYNTVNSGKFIGEASEKFFDAFDSAVLSVYPDFISRLNSLLKPDKRFGESENGKLTPEQRLAALLLMDITDSARLSEILGLSLNTIYTYRNRLKGRAIDRSTFEESLQSL